MALNLAQCRALLASTDSPLTSMDEFNSLSSKLSKILSWSKRFFHLRLHDVSNRFPNRSLNTNLIAATIRESAPTAPSATLKFTGCLHHLLQKNNSKRLGRNIFHYQQFSAVQSSAQTFIHNAILFNDTSDHS